MSQIPGELAHNMIKKVVSKLKEEGDIEGVLLVGDKNHILAHELPKDINFEAEIPKILALLEKWGGFGQMTPHNDMFAHCILDYNGSKILAKRLENNFTLLIMLQKQGYIGLAMLNLENSAMEIASILGA